MSGSLDIDQIEDRFLIQGRMEILTLLNELIYRDQPVTIHFADQKSLVTRFLEARENILIFASSAEPQLDDQLLAASSCIFAARPDGICIQFSSGKVTPVQWGEHLAFSIPLPKRLARLQRQESFRTVFARDHAIPVELLASGGRSLGQWPLHDLSAGGIGVNADQRFPVAASQDIHSVRMLLPGHGEIDSLVVLQHITDLAQSSASYTCRIGLAFSGLQPQMRAAIQRYIVDVEHERNSQSFNFETDDD